MKPLLLFVSLILIGITIGCGSSNEPAADMSIPQEPAASESSDSSGDYETALRYYKQITSSQKESVSVIYMPTIAELTEAIGKSPIVYELWGNHYCRWSLTRKGYSSVDYFSVEVDVPNSPHARAKSATWSSST